MEFPASNHSLLNGTQKEDTSLNTSAWLAEEIVSTIRVGPFDGDMRLTSENSAGRDVSHGRSRISSMTTFSSYSISKSAHDDSQVVGGDDESEVCREGGVQSLHPQVVLRSPKGPGCCCCCCSRSACRSSFRPPPRRLPPSGVVPPCSPPQAFLPHILPGHCIRVWPHPPSSSSSLPSCWSSS